MLPTPSTSHVSFDSVYEPAEDSFLFLDTLASPRESAWLRARFREPSPRDAAGPVLLEVGTGSGVVVAFAAAHADRILGRADVLALGTDVNVLACVGSAQTVSTAVGANAATSAVFGDIVNADLAGPLRAGVVDVLLFNPPYVPTEAVPDQQQPGREVGRAPTSTFERDSWLLSLSYAGGVDGMEVTDRLLAELPRILHPVRGVAYVLLCAQNRPSDVRDRMQGLPGFAAELVSSSGKQAGWEKLQILRIWRVGDGE